MESISETCLKFSSTAVMAGVIILKCFATSNDGKNVMKMPNKRVCKSIGLASSVVGRKRRERQKKRTKKERKKEGKKRKKEKTTSGEGRSGWVGARLVG